MPSLALAGLGAAGLVLVHSYLWWCTAACLEPLLPCTVAAAGCPETSLLPCNEQTAVAAGDIVLITGAAPFRSVGSQLALLYASRGAELVLSADAALPLEVLAKRCEAAGAGSVLAVPGTPAELSRSGALLEKVKSKHGRLDVLVLAHADSPTELFQEAKQLTGFEAAVESTFLSSVRLVHQALPLLEETHRVAGKHGRVAFVGSAGTFFTPLFKSAYTSAAAALASFAATLRAELELAGRAAAPSLTMLHVGDVAEAAPPVPAHARGAGFEQPHSWAIPSADAAATAARAVDRRLSEAFAPSGLWLASWLHWLPSALRPYAYKFAVLADRPELQHRVLQVQRVFPNRVEPRPGPP